MLFEIFDDLFLLELLLEKCFIPLGTMLRRLLLRRETVVIPGHGSELGHLVVAKPGACQANSQKHPHIDIQVFRIVTIVSVQIVANTLDVLKQLVGIDVVWFVLEVLANEFGQSHDRVAIVGVSSPSVFIGRFELVVDSTFEYSKLRFQFGTLGADSIVFHVQISFPGFLCLHLFSKRSNLFVLLLNPILQLCYNHIAVTGARDFWTRLPVFVLVIRE